MKFKSKFFHVFFLVVFCLIGIEAQTVLIHIRSSNPPSVKGDSGGLSFPCQEHACGCKDAHDCRNHCCCSKMPLSDAPVQIGIPCFTKTLHCRGVHTDIPVSHLTQYEPLMDKIAGFILAHNCTLLPQDAKKPLEVCPSPPYKPPEESILC